MLGVNLTGVFLTFRAALGQHEGAGWGRLIAMASTAGLKGYPYVSAYAAAKHGVIGLVRSAALETARTGITVQRALPRVRGHRDDGSQRRQHGQDRDGPRRGARQPGEATRRTACSSRRRSPPPRCGCADAGSAGVNGHALAIVGGRDMNQPPGPRREPLSKAALRVWLRLLKAQRTIEGACARLRTGHDSTLPRFDVLSALATAFPRG
jgi:NAD(P)-dependent dehydrogenase (short-subunit alcohol dehydrogenase family)